MDGTSKTRELRLTRAEPLVGARHPDWLLREIAEGTASATGPAFFSSLVRHGATALQVRAAFLTECTDEANTRVRQLASFKDGEFALPYEYDLAGAPCESVMAGRTCFYPCQVERLFPLEQGLGMESYIGLPLLDSTNRVIGHLVVWDGQPMAEDTPALSVLRIFAARAAAELERLHSERALRDSEERYRLLFEGSPQPALVCDARTLGIIEVNEAAVERYGYPRAVFEAMSLHEVAEGGGGREPLEANRHRLSDGSVIEVEVSGHGLMVAGREAQLLLVNDVTERRKLETERAQQFQLLEGRFKVRTSEIDRRRQVARGLREVLGVLTSGQDLGEILASIIAQAGLLLGTDAGAVYSVPVPGDPPVTDKVVVPGAQGFEPALLHVTDRSALEALIGQVSATRRAEAVHIVKGFGAARFRALLAVPLIVRDEVRSCMVLYSINSRSFLEDDLELAETLGTYAALALETARLRLEAGRMAVMEERERLSRELHDSVTQSLYSLSLFAEAGRRHASVGDLGQARDHLSLLGNTARQTLKEMRLMVHELRPSALEGVGLVGALRRRLDAVEERAGIMTRLHAPPALRLPPALEDALFLVAQEALNNSLRHARAGNVTVRVEVRDGRLTLEVEDDGCGCDLGTATGAGGIGLIAMRERAEKLGADLEVLSAPGQGTLIRLRTLFSVRP